MKLYLRGTDTLLLIILITFTCDAKLGNNFKVTVDEHYTNENESVTQRELQSGWVGEWGMDYNMKVIPIHSMLLPDGCVLGYGTNSVGKQRADLYYEIWDSTSGAHEEARLLLEHQTKADMFCSTLNMDISTGNIIIFGGDLRDDGKNLGSDTILELDTKTHEITHHSKGRMIHPRWYATSINLPNGDIFIVGGKSVDKTYIAIPEIWSPENGSRELPNAIVPAIAQSTKKHWWYPHVYLSSRGAIFIIMPHGNNADVYHVEVEGNGSIKKIGEKPFKTHVLDPSIMYRQDKILFLDNNGQLWTFDISANPLVFQKNIKIGPPRTNGFFALLPDGRVAITGGNASAKNQGNDLVSAVLSIQIWDPVTNELYNGGNQTIARLYHSTSLVIPDGSVVSAGGGAPGPFRNLNGQLFYPDYVFDENHEPIKRPEITQCPRNIENDKKFIIHVDKSSRVTRVTASKSGASTHARNCDARWVELDFKVIDESRIRVSVKDENVMIPGLWMINTINKKGTPSHACLLGVNTAELKT